MCTGIHMWKGERFGGLLELSSRHSLVKNVLEIRRFLRTRVEMDHSRHAVEKYPVKCIFIDLSYPWTRDVSENVFMALLRFFATASNVVGSNRIPALSLVIIGKTAECIFPLQAMKSNIAKLMHVLHEVKMQDGTELDDRTYRDTFSDAVKLVFTQFNRSFYANKQQHWSSLTQIEACLITCQRQTVIERCLEYAFNEDYLECLKKIQVIRVNDTCMQTTVLEETSADLGVDTAKMDALHDYLEFVTVANCTIEVEFALKPWLVDYGVDDIQVIIDINGKLNQKGVKLKCDLSDRLLRLSMVPSYQSKLFQAPVQQTSCHHCQPMNSNLSVNVYHFCATQLIHLSGICESVIHGQPLIIRPTSCWKLDWEELDLNQQRFQAIRSFLLKQEMGILLESRETGTNNPKTFCILLPSNGCGMLLKCVANSDVLLPLSSSLCIQKESDEIEREVESLLLEVPKVSVLNPLHLKAGISDKLLEVFQSSESKKNARGFTKNPYLPRNPASKSTMEVKPNISNSSHRPANSHATKRGKFSSRSLPHKGSIFTIDPPEFPETF